MIQDENQLPIQPYGESKHFSYVMKGKKRRLHFSSPNTHKSGLWNERNHNLRDHDIPRRQTMHQSHLSKCKMILTITRRFTESGYSPGFHWKINMLSSRRRGRFWGRTSPIRRSAGRTSPGRRMRGYLTILQFESYLFEYT